jgi:hypothetical protein
MGWLANILGTVSNLFSIGDGGPNWKNNAGALEARNNADSAFAVVRAADPVGAQDAVTKTFGDNNYGQITAPRYAESMARQTTTLAAYQDAVTLTTASLTGDYLIEANWLIDNLDKLGQSRLYNSTDAAVLGAVCEARTKDGVSGQNSGYCIRERVTFTGAAKTFKIQWQDGAGGNTQGISAAVITIRQA